MRLVEIAAIGRNNELGKDNHMVFDLPGDLKFFAKTTKGHPIVMGRNTWLSLPKKLPGRKHIILSRTLKTDDDDIDVCASIGEFMDRWGSYDGDIYCIGGGHLYKQMLGLADELVLTEVDGEADAQVFFPEFDKTQYVSRILGQGCDNGVHYTHVSYVRKEKS